MGGDEQTWGKKMVIDDLFMTDSLEKYVRDMNAFIDLCKSIGVPWVPGKYVGPATCVGITLDAVSMEARLPGDKLTQCRLLL